MLWVACLSSQRSMFGGALAIEFLCFGCIITCARSSFLTNTPGILVFAFVFVSQWLFMAIDRKKQTTFPLVDSSQQRECNNMQQHSICGAPPLAQSPIAINQS